MVMKRFFAKDNFLFSGFDAHQRHQSLFVVMMIALLFLASSFTFVNALYAFADALGSLVSGSMDVMVYDLLRSVPLFLSCFMSIWGLLLFHAYFRNADEKRRKRSLYKNSITLICFGGINVLYILLGLALGKFVSLVEGSPSPIYPLDAFLYSLLFIGLGVFGVVYAKKLESKLPYVVPSRGPIVTKARFGYCFFVSIWMLIGFFCFWGFLVGLFIIDFEHGHLAYGIGLLLVYLTNFCFLVVWEFYYNELKEEARKRVLLPLSIIALCVSVPVIAYYFIALGLNLDGPANIGFGVSPIAFAANLNIAGFILVATPLIVAVTALVKALVLRKKSKAE